VSLSRGWGSVVCIASGPSLSVAQLGLVGAAQQKGSVHTIVTNTTWAAYRQADILYACDQMWWKVYISEVRAGFKGELWTRNRAAATQYGLNHITSYGKPGLTDVPNAIHEGGNSGYQIMNLAYLFGARRIIMVGYDMKSMGKVTHHHGAHPSRLSNSHPFEKWVPRFKPLADGLRRAGVEVVNCTSSTALECFPRADLEQTLCGL
jgi:hypothetical protein